MIELPLPESKMSQIGGMRYIFSPFKNSLLVTFPQKRILPNRQEEDAETINFG
jgi:hypothetical protein